jgi:hypothetical protein
MDRAEMGRGILLWIDLEHNSVQWFNLLTAVINYAQLKEKF